MFFHIILYYYIKREKVKMIYLDNSASTFIKPKEVISATCEGLTKYSANPGRSGHMLSTIAAVKVENVREKICNFFNAESAIFTENCTDALNLAIQGIVKENMHVICTTNDHNASVRPLFELQRKLGIEISVSSPKDRGILSIDDILPHVKQHTKIICLNHMSNVDGEIADIEKIGQFCKEKNIIFIVDAAQSAGHIKIDMKKFNIDFLALAPHKGLYAPQGVGVLACTNKVSLQPIRFGGTGTESENLYQPLGTIETYESGTLPTPNILGLGAGIDFVKKNFTEINDKIDDLSTYLNYELSNINGVTVYTHPNNAFGVIGFNVADYGSTDVSQLLSDKYDICTRGGLHCAGLKHKFLNTTKQGIVRASLSYFNTFNDCQRLVKAIKHIAKYGY